MAKLLFSLRGVPDEEADEIIDLLNVNNLDFYETSAGNWGVSMPALWIINDSDYEKAQNLLNQYHQERAVSQREQYDRLKKEGQSKSIKDIFFQQPIRFLVYVGGIVFILYISIKVLFEIGL